MTDVPRTSPERPIIWSLGHPLTGSRRRPVDVAIYNFWIFVLPVKNSNRCVKQRLFPLKNPFFIKSSIFCWSPEGPLVVPDIRTFSGPSEYVPGTSCTVWAHFCIWITDIITTTAAFTCFNTKRIKSRIITINVNNFRFYFTFFISHWNTTQRSCFQWIYTF